MKIKEIKIKKFKRFTDLVISDIPETARLVVLVGPNGCGKTSLFEAFNHFYKLQGYNDANNSEQVYFEKKDDTPSTGQWFRNMVQITFHNGLNPNAEQLKGKFYFRTASEMRQTFLFLNYKIKRIQLNR
jgi:AAA15 family ATPase/GTPase